jgi:hypothetical protein
MKLNSFRNICLTYLLLLFINNSIAQVQPLEQWWLKEPFRLVQTNLREIDAIDFDLEVYVNSIRETGANIVLINVGGIVANYYTGLEYQYQNPHLKFDMIEQVTDRLHREGIRVIGRFDFSKLNEELAAKKPGWLYKSLKHEVVNYNGQVHTCVNGGYQQEFSLAILKEALERFPLDGVFFNMIGYQVRDYSNTYHGICQADACRERFKTWSGGLDLPVKEDGNDPVFRRYQQFKSETSDELFFRIHDLIKSFGNHIGISTYTHAGTDFYRKESNSHDALYDNFVPWEYQSAHNVKSAIGSWKDKQVSNAAVHFYGYPARHTADARWLTQQRLFQNIMYGAGPDFYCIGRLDNLEDRTVLQNVSDVFRFHRNNEKFLHHTVSGNEVLLLHDGQSGNEYKGIFEMLTENHVLFDVMEHWCIDTKNLPREIESYKVIILPEISRLSDAQCEKLDAYVEKGGKLLITGFTSTKDENGNPLDKIRLKSPGVEPVYKTFEKEQGTYYRIFPKDKNLLSNPVFDGFDIVYAWEKGLHCTPLPGATGMLGFIPPAMIGPPEKTYYTEVTDIPGLILNTYGTGKTAYFTFRPGALFHHTRHYSHAALVVNALTNLLGYDQDLKMSASPLVEVSRQKNPRENVEWFALLNHSGQLGNGFHEPLPIRDISISFKPAKPVRSLRRLTNGESLHYQQGTDNHIELILPELNSFDIILVEY